MSKKNTKEVYIPPYGKVATFELIEKPQDTEYKNGWVYETIQLKEIDTCSNRRDEMTYVFTGISHTKSWSSLHPKRNKVLEWANKAKVGDRCILMYEYTTAKEKDITELKDVFFIRTK